MKVRTLAIFTIISFLIVGCNGPNIQRILKPNNPYEQYQNFLQSSEFDNAALVRDWVEAGKVAPLTPIEINLPYQEISHFDKNQPQAIFLEFEAKEGQMISAKVDLISTADSKFFIDLFEIGNADRKSILFAKDTNRVEYKVKNSGRLGLRIQPELFRGGLVEISIQQNPSLAFPIIGKTHRNIASFFGNARDGGKRLHEGIDVFAARGTPITAVSPGRVSSVGMNRLGGKTVRVSHDGYSYYYAHLDSQLVSAGQKVRVGYTLGTVGNTGNAITTAPHLHFGIYSSGRGAVDPFPFFEEKAIKAPLDVSDTTHLGKMARIQVPSANLRKGPNTQAVISQKLSQNEIVHLQGKINEWYRVLLPDGRMGYLFKNLVNHNLSTIAVVENVEGLLIREAFIKSQNFEASILGEKLEYIGEFQDSRLLRTGSGSLYWSFD
jgi:murein DD-endopeptidase MepM/ murein hydrolase activator NlpD/SH3-like domain-containing protein